MILRRALTAELRKTATLPATSAAVAVAVLGTAGITVLNSFSVRDALRSGRTELVAYTSPVDTAFSAVPLGTVGAVILGVTAISSEYTANSSAVGGGRQIAATFTATPRRHTVLAAKTLSVALLVLATAAAAIPACLIAAHLIIGDDAPAADDIVDTFARSAGAALYWVLTALLAFAITVLTRSGLVPLVVFIANSSLVSVSLLLSNITPLARYLPDLAGTGMYARDTIAVDKPLDPIIGGLVMAAWVLGLLTASAAVFGRRDA